MMKQKPILVINFKAYKEGSGKNALALAKKIEKVSQHHAVEVILAVQAIDLPLLNKISLPIFVQHVDPFEYGANTGSILPEAVKLYGAKGTLINHSEKRISISSIEKTIQICKEKNLMTIACAENNNEAKSIAAFNPDFIAIEPKELIGGTISVSEARPQLIQEAVQSASSVPLLCGAGIQNGKDFKKALSLGAKGILVSSSLVKHENPERKLKEFLSF